MKQSTLKNQNLESDLILDEAMLQMPINRTKQLQDLIKLKIQEQKIIEQVNTKALSFKQSKQTSRINKPSSQKPITKPAITALQQEFRTNNANSSYVVSCVIRALKYRKLAIDDVADIFGIDGEVVEEIDKFRRLRELEGEEDPSLGVPNQRLDMKKQILMKEMQMKFKNATYEKVIQNSFTSNHLPKRSNSSSFIQPSRFTSNYRPQTLSNSDLTSILQTQQQQQQEQSLFEYQRLMRKPPPHRVDEKVRAIVQILKKHPNIMQKDAVKILADEYGIKNMTQTSISRYYKKIYEMRRHVGVLLQAKKEGFIDI